MEREERRAAEVRLGTAAGAGRGGGARGGERLRGTGGRIGRAHV